MKCGVLHSLLLPKPMFKCSFSPTTSRLGRHAERFLKNDKDLVSKKHSGARSGKGGA